MAVAVYILTYNEELHIARCIQSVRPFADEIHVVDSGSADRTVAIAESLGARVVTHAFRNHADQFQWAIDTIPATTDWIMRIDADEIVEPDLATRIAAGLGQLPADVSGVTLDRKHIFMGRWIRHGGRYPLRLLRIFRRGRGRVEQRWMDEHIVVEGGRIVHFDGGFADHNLNDLTYFIAKHNGYATREAVEVLIRRMTRPEHGDTARHSSQTGARRWLKEHAYARLPFGLSAAAYFLFRYLVQLGFLDGREGLIYHFLQAGWYRFLVGAKIVELERAVSANTDVAPFVTIQAVTGLMLDQSSPGAPK
jgi:glycosyltransferase involved in cell wall biosynthesis